MITLLTYLHIIAGVISLIVAPIALAVAKGGYVHRLTGKIFFWCMTTIFVSAIILSTLKSIPFLLMIAIFSYYSVIVGYRSVHQKAVDPKHRVKWYDWFAVTISGLFNLAFVTWGSLHIIEGNFLHYLAIGFGTGGLLVVWSQIRMFTRTYSDRRQWLYAHIGNMTGGFIASVTAFSTQVLTFLPDAFQWIWPSLVGVPIIFYWIKREREKVKVQPII
ncbi:MAG: hypothetical protein R2820_13685 [Cyclobacteriaceae bacterium]|nr:hypothetical protein [Cyclobacteriaceae bacterium]